MVGLLDLPSELLFLIIELVLTSPVVQPENGTRLRTTWWKTWDLDLYCIPNQRLARPRTTNLLLLNRRMYSETREYLKKAPRNFEIDLAIIDDRWLWPTARVVPARTLDGVIDRIELNIIPCCTAGNRHLQKECNSTRPDMFQLYSGSFVTEALLAPLTLFLLYPQGDERMEKPPSHVFRGLEMWLDPLLDTGATGQLDRPVTRVDTIALFIDTSRCGNGDETLSRAVVPWRTVEDIPRAWEGPWDFKYLYPVDYAKSEHYLRGLSSLIDEWADHSVNRGVEEKIGKVQFYLNKDMWKEVDFRNRRYGLPT
ncbi:hypothetical protein GMOD_00009920 [Pyrenophora seminiperda CCB06]|uniref:Uncharacterized protein n=1 Tax=Pyrenophora seminiperda CCB06 TaxID=1302712 RepID=A0A3M7M1C9_9PLEO|nr:hypothetical protein GMOD_00009920 [Pyrenophora seminiperda CCB06]